MQAKIFLQDENAWLPVVSINFLEQVVTVSRQFVLELLGISPGPFHNASEHQKIEVFQRKYSGGLLSTAGFLFYLQLFRLGDNLIIE